MYRNFFFCLCMAVVLGMGLTACGDELMARDNPNDPQVAGLSSSSASSTNKLSFVLFNSEAETLLDRSNKIEWTLQTYVNSSVLVYASVRPITAEQSVKFSSADSTVATVELVENTELIARVNGRSVGTTWIYVESAGSKDSLPVRVLSASEAAVLQSVKLRRFDGIPLDTVLRIAQTRQIQLTAVVIPNNANQSVQWISSDTKIVSVSNGLIEGKMPGAATIKAVAANGVAAEIVVKVVTEVMGFYWDIRTHDQTLIINSNRSGFFGGSWTPRIYNDAVSTPLPSVVPKSTAGLLDSLLALRSLVSVVTLPSDIQTRNRAGLTVAFEKARSAGFALGGGLCLSYASNSPLKIILSEDSLLVKGADLVHTYRLQYELPSTGGVWKSVNVNWNQFEQPYETPSVYLYALEYSKVRELEFMFVSGEQEITATSPARLGIRSLGIPGECVFGE